MMGRRLGIARWSVQFASHQPLTVGRAGSHAGLIAFLSRLRLADAALMRRAPQLKYLLIGAIVSITTPIYAAITSDRTFKPGDDNDPIVRESDYLAADSRYFSALTSLLSIRLAVPGISPAERLGPDFTGPQLAAPPAPADYVRRLADNSLAFGMRERAGELYHQLGTDSSDPRAMTAAKLRLADFDFERGYLSQATDELTALRRGLPVDLQNQWQETMTRVLLAQGRYAEADRIMADPDSSTKATQYMRYNLGITKINQGQITEGQNLLDRVGRFHATDDEGLALKDKANLVLAYDFLRREQGGTAVPIFQRIRLDGPFSARALLGLGWAELSPRGEVHRREIAESEFGNFASMGTVIRPGYVENMATGEDRRYYNRSQTGTEERHSWLGQALDALKPLITFGATNKKSGGPAKTLSPAEEEAYRRALIPWSELIRRDPMDPAVQEGMLAIPYTLNRMGAHTQARDFYLHAVVALEQTRQRLGDAMDHVRSGRMIATIIHRDADAETGWEWHLHDLPDAPETFYLQNLLAENRFQEALKNYRDVLLLSRTFNAWMVRLNTMQAAYGERRLHAAPVETVVDYARKEAPEAPKYNVVDRPQLKLSDHLSPPDDTHVVDSTPAQPLQLAAAATPNAQVFSGGVWERIEALKARTTRLQPQLDSAAAREKVQIEAMAIAELELQDKTAENYLVDARLALARIYDHHDAGVTP